MPRAGTSLPDKNRRLFFNLIISRSGHFVEATKVFRGKDFEGAKDSWQIQISNSIPYTYCLCQNTLTIGPDHFSRFKQEFKVACFTITTTIRTPPTLQNRRREQTSQT